jgi:hypothetical protein
MAILELKVGAACKRDEKLKKQGQFMDIHHSGMEEAGLLSPDDAVGMPQGEAPPLS